MKILKLLFAHNTAQAHKEGLTKWLSNGKSLKKIEIYSNKSTDRGFYKDGVRVSDFSRRLYSLSNEKDWL